MRFNLVESPRLLSTSFTPGWIHLRVISGNALISTTRQNLDGGGGLPIAVADGLVSLKWPSRELWVQCPIGGAGEVEVVL